MKYGKLNRKCIFFIISLIFISFVNADPFPDLQKISGDVALDLNSPPGSCNCMVFNYGNPYINYCGLAPNANYCTQGFDPLCFVESYNGQLIASCGCNCVGPDPVCTPGQVRDCGPTTNLGICEFGTEECNNLGQWSGICEGAVYPEIEICNDELDNDCDSYIDCEDNNCAFDPGCVEDCVYVNYYYNDDCGEDANLINSWGRLCKIEDCSGGTEFEYDEKGNIIKQEVKINGYEDSFILEYEYDSQNNLIREILPNGDIVEYKYNELNRVEEVSYNNIDVDFFYTIEGLFEETDYRHVETDYEYDFMDRIEEIVIESEREEIFNREYEYDNVGNLIGLYENGNLLAEYIYDNLYRLIIIDDDYYYDFDLLNFIYDKVGNRLSKDEDSSLINYNYEVLSNRLLSIDEGTDEILELEYDSSGNLIGMDDTKYRYDIKNQLVSVDEDGNNVADEHYWYNYEGKRVKKINGVIPSNPAMQGEIEITYYVYDIKGDMVYSIKEDINNWAFSKTPIGGSVMMPRDKR